MSKKQFFTMVAFCLLINSVIHAQVTFLGNNAVFPPQYVGYSGIPAVNSKPLDIKNNYAAQDINFFTNLTGINGSSVQRMVIKNTTGFVGIGPNSFTTPFQLGVDDNIDLKINYAASPGYGYRINGTKLLSHPGTRNSFVGENAGASWSSTTTYSHCTFVGANAGPVNSGEANTFCGESAGLKNTTGDYNTFVGSNAGESNTTGRRNTFLGHHAGYNNTTGSDNTFIGYHTVGLLSACTGSFNTATGVGAIGQLSTGSSNAMYGWIAGRGLTSGSDNCVYGKSSGQFLQTGSSNSFFGMNSGIATTTGNGNVFMGRNAGVFNRTGNNNVIIGNLANMLSGQINLSNAIAIGFQAIVSDNDKMILGNNNINVGIGLSNSAVGAGPQKKLEINETGVSSPLVANPTIPGTFGGSGLRFRKLTAATPTAAANGKVLTVNSNGDVILVSDQTSTVAAGSIFAQNGLSMVGTNTVELGGILIRPVTTIDFNGNELNYTDGSPTKLYVRGANGGTYNKAVGPPPFGTPETVFYEELQPNAASVSGFGRETYVIAASSAVGTTDFVGSRQITNAVAATSVALSGTVSGYWSRTQNTGPSAKDNFAFRAEALGAGPTGINAGYVAHASGGPKNYGFFEEMFNNALPSTIEDVGNKVIIFANPLSNDVIGSDIKLVSGKNVYGVRSQPQGGSVSNYGVFAKVPNGTAGSVNYGIWAEAPPSGTNVSYAGYFQGNVFINGIASYPSGPIPSDQVFKTNIDTISNAMNILKQLKPRTFFYDTTNINNINFPNQRQYGLIAQDVQSILPELVVNTTKPIEFDSLGNVTAPPVTFKSLNYNAFIAILIKGMQQQQKMIEKQDSVMQQMQSQIAALTSSVNSCCSSSAVRTTSQEEQNQLAITLSDKDAIVLNQNVPNPFAEQTTITYNVPEKYGYAQLVFSTIEGRILKTVDITKKGRGTLNVFANDLGSGMYTYSLIVDGKVMDTKKMVKQE